MNPIEFLNLADRLHASADEAERRTSVSRSYYAAYHVLVQALSAEQVPFEKSGDDHGRLDYYLTESGDQQAQQMGGKLRGLRSDRRDADYKLRRFIKVWDSRLAYGKAKEVIEGFNAIRPHEFQQLVGVIKALPPYTPRR